MKYQIVFFILVTAITGNANASDFRSIKCGQFKYMDRVSIDVDLETTRFVVRKQQPRTGGENQILGEGLTGPNPIIENDHVTFPLYENSRFVGFLRATEAGRHSEPSYLDYKGVNYGYNSPFYCYFFKSTHGE